MISDGFGGLMEDPAGTTYTYKFRVRISHQKSSVPASSSSPIGLATNLQKMITIDYKGGPIEGEQFTIPDETKVSVIQMVSDTGIVVADDGDPIANITPTDSPSGVYTIGKIDQLTENGEIIGYQAALTQAGV